MPSSGTAVPRGKCFVMQPFDGGKFDSRYTDVFEPAIRAADLEPYRVDRDPSVDVPIDEIERGIVDSIICFAEITTDNPNVWYELGYASSAGKSTCLVCSSERQNAFPFDIRHRSIIKYKVDSPSDFAKASAQITSRLKALLKKQAEIESLFTLRPAAESQGLTPHEVAVMALIMAQFETPGVTGWQLKQDMNRAGYTDIAAGIAIEKLRRAGYLNQVTAEDDRGEKYLVWTLTAKGTEWLISNENKVSLRTEAKQEFDANDIPF